LGCYFLQKAHPVLEIILKYFVNLFFTSQTNTLMFVKDFMSFKKRKIILHHHFCQVVLFNQVTLTDY